MNGPAGILTACCHVPLTARARFDAEVVLLRCSRCGRLAGAPGPEDSEHVAALIERRRPGVRLQGLTVAQCLEALRNANWWPAAGALAFVSDTAKYMINRMGRVDDWREL